MSETSSPIPAEQPTSEPTVETPTPIKLDKSPSELKITIGLTSKQKTDEDFVQKFFDALFGVKFIPGRFNKPYSTKIMDFRNLRDVDPNMELNVDAEGFQQLGLSCNVADDVVTIEGLPTSGYDGKVIVSTRDCEFNTKISFSNPSKFFTGIFGKFFTPATEIAKPDFFIAPDPASLWEDLPTPKDAPYQKPNVDKFGAALVDAPSYVMLAASQRGRSHANEGRFRDDHFAIRLGETSDDWSVVAVADGAGSARFSREGAKIACETCCEILGEDLKVNKDVLDAELHKFLNENDAQEEKKALSEIQITKPLTKAIYQSYLKIQNEGLQYKNDHPETKFSDYSTTLLCAVFKRLKLDDERSKWVVASYWIGDGGLVIYRPNGKASVIPLGKPDAGEFAGQTRFLTSSPDEAWKNVPSRLHIKFVDDFQALALMTDGITDPFFPAEINISEYSFWQKFWDETLPTEFPNALDKSKSPEERADALLNGLQFRVVGNHDDRTIALLINDEFVPKPVVAEPAESKEAEPSETGAATESAEGVKESEVVSAAETSESVAEKGAAQESAETQESNELPPPAEIIVIEQETTETSESVTENGAAQESTENQETNELPPPAEIIVIEQETTETPESVTENGAAQESTESQESNELPPPPLEIEASQETAGETTVARESADSPSTELKEPYIELKKEAESVPETDKGFENQLGEKESSEQKSNDSFTVSPNPGAMEPDAAFNSELAKLQGSSHPEESK